MTKIIQEVRAISSEKIAEKQKFAENAYPKVIEKIKAAAATGTTECLFQEYEIDQFTKRLLEADGFGVNITTKRSEQRDYKDNLYPFNKAIISIWRVTW